MIMNKKDLIIDMIDLPEADGISGTVGFGINGMIAEFADIEMDCIPMSSFMKFIELLRKGEELESNEEKVEISESSPEQSSESSPEGSSATSSEGY